MLRMAGERQTLTGDNEEAPGLTRTADPLMSIIQLIRSRTVGADVVDSLGLQLYSQTEEFSIGDLEHIKVDPRAASDSVVLTFGDKDVNARRGDRAVTARYGQPINLGVVQFTVTARPAVETATLGINSREGGDRWAGERAGRDPAGRDRRHRRDLHVGRPAGGPADREHQRAGVPVAQRAVGPRAFPPAQRVPRRAAGPDRQHAGPGPGRSQQLPEPAAARQLREQAERDPDRDPPARRPGGAAPRPTGRPSARSSSSSRAPTRAPAIRRSAPWPPRPPSRRIRR